MHGLVRDTYDELMDRKVIWIFLAITLFAMLISALISASDIQIKISQPGMDHAPQNPFGDLPARGVSTFLSLLIFVSAMTAASTIPSMLSRGRIDFFAAKPVSRSGLYLGRFFGLVIVFGTICLISGGIVYSLLAVIMKPFNAGVLYIFLFALLELFVWLSIVAAVGLMTASTTVAIVTAFLFWITQTLLGARQFIEALTDSQAVKYILDTLYWIIPKTSQLSKDGLALAMGNDLEQWLTTPATLAFGLVALLGAAVIFGRKEL
jgi:ABC-type transport system involved in multi-copper enzyme maturation permease subunit